MAKRSPPQVQRRVVVSAPLSGLPIDDQLRTIFVRDEKESVQAVEAGKKRLADDIVRQALPTVSSVEGALLSPIVLSRTPRIEPPASQR